MKEILFRGKRLDNDEWVEGDLFQHDDGSTEIFVHKQTMFAGKLLEGRWYHVNPDTVGRYTGLADKNGVKIFEGDNISVKNENNVEIFHFEVKFGKCGGTHNVEHDVGYMGFYFQPQPIVKIVEEYMLRKDPIYWLIAYKCEVIGNIYDNKELMNDT